METIKKQATKLREHVARQQQAVLKQISGRFGHDFYVAEEAELQCHQRLQMLYSSTKAAKHFQRDVVRGVEAFISISSKQMEIVKKLAQDCCKYGNERETSDFPLAKAAFEFGTSHKLMETEREALLRSLGDQISEPLRAMIMGAPLEDARHLTHRYERIRQDVEAQTAEVSKRQLKSKEVGVGADSTVKLKNAESKLSELRTALSVLGREATSAMTSVEAQQQQITFQKLLETVEAEKSYHQKVAGILEKLHEEMVSMKQNSESPAHATTIVTNTHFKPFNEESSQAGSLPANVQDSTYSTAEVIHPFENTESHAHATTIVVDTRSQPINEESNQAGNVPANGQDSTYFVAEVIHPFDAQADGELNLSMGDYVVVRQVAPNGWSEGECKGKAGWFPSTYVHQRDKAPASKVLEASMLS